MGATVSQAMGQAKVLHSKLSVLRVVCRRGEPKKVEHVYAHFLPDPEELTLGTHTDGKPTKKPTNPPCMILGQLDDPTKL